MGQMYRDIAVSKGSRIRYIYEIDVLSKAIIFKDLCREDRERSRQKYLAKKQRREAEQERDGSTVTDDQNRVPPQNNDENRPDANIGITASPHWVVIDSVS